MAKATTTASKGKTTKAAVVARSTRKSATEKTRMKAADQMAQRTRLTYGEAFIRDVIDGKQRDWAKQIGFAVAAGFSTAAKLAKMSNEEMRTMIGDKLKSMSKTARAALPTSSTIDGVVTEATVH